LLPDVKNEYYNDHCYFIDISNKVVAHPVYSSKVYCSTIFIAHDGECLKRGVFGFNGVSALLPSCSEVKLLCALVQDWKKQIALDISKLDLILNTEIADMSDQDLIDLPDGFAPFDISFTKVRNWPK
jgi:hypothetical protein